MSESSETTTVRGRMASAPKGLLVGILVVAVILAGVAGFGIGVKVEQSRTSSEKSKAAASKKAAAAKKKRAVTAVNEVVGKVTANNGKTVTVKNSKGKSVTVAIPKTVVVRTTTKGSTSDLSKGSRILFKASSYTQAKEVVILPASGKAGVLLTAATGNSLSYRMKSGKTVTLKTTGATVDTTAVGTLSNVAKDSTVIVMTRRFGKTSVATEIIVLPPGSAFA